MNDETWSTIYTRESIRASAGLPGTLASVNERHGHVFSLDLRIDIEVRVGALGPASTFAMVIDASELGVARFSNEKKCFLEHSADADTQHTSMFVDDVSSSPAYDTVV